MKANFLKSCLLLSIVLLAASCKKDSPQQGELSYKEPSLPATPYDYAAKAKQLPANQITVNNHKATLGRVLFYEKALSVNNLIACGSCHVQSMAFADGRQFSPGFELLQTTRNSPAIMNAGAMKNYFWDARATGLENMVTMPIQNHLEMGIENLEYAAAKINSIPYYKELFKNAFGTETADEENITKALANFLASMVSADTKYDKSIGNAQNKFNNLENMGMQLFNGLHCNNCHSVHLSSASWLSQVKANIGLDEVYEDNGVFDPNDPQRNSPSLKGKFKVPSLRNIALTAPYMHDGRFATLEEVIEHYNSGVKMHPNLDWSLSNVNLDNMNASLPTGMKRPLVGSINDPMRLSLTEIEKSALIAFLNTLTDEEYTTNPMYSDPFNY